MRSFACWSGLPPTTILIPSGEAALHKTSWKPSPGTHGSSQ